MTGAEDEERFITAAERFSAAHTHTPVCKSGPQVCLHHLVPAETQLTHTAAVCMFELVS